MTIEELEKKLKKKIYNIDKRIERLSQPSFYDQSQKIENLHGEAIAYEKVLQMIKN